MKVSAKTLLPIMALGTMAMAHGQSNVVSRSVDYATKYLSTNNDVLELSNYDLESVQQAKLDSLAFRNIFNQTSAANDEERVAEFESIANDMQCTFNEIDRILTDEGITEEEYPYDSFNLDMDTLDNSPHYQYFADNWMYRKFFERIGIMTDSVKKACNRVSGIIKP